jgi:hypothetical protein
MTGFTVDMLCISSGFVHSFFCGCCSIGFTSFFVKDEGTLRGRKDESFLRLWHRISSLILHPSAFVTSALNFSTIAPLLSNLIE